MTPNSSPLKTLSPSSVTENGFISVKRTLQLTNEQYPKVFAMGDIADIGPKNARVIITQSELVARNIQRISAGDAKQLEKYTYTGETIYLSLGLVCYFLTRTSTCRDE
jgi:NADH dehydrogenase FAD-containing subunit